MLTDEEIEKCREKAVASYKRHYHSTKGQQVTDADDPEMHLIWEVIAACEAKLLEIKYIAANTAQLMRAVEWLYSGDDSEETFLRKVGGCDETSISP